MPKNLPKRMHFKHGRYYYVHANRWHALSRDLAEALRQYADLIARDGYTGLQALIQRTLDDMGKTLADNTLRVYRRSAAVVGEAFVEFQPSEIRAHHVAEFLDGYRSQPDTGNQYRAFLSAMMGRAARWGLVDFNPVRDVKPLPKAKRDRYITDAEYAAIRAHAVPQLQCVMDLAYMTGQRIGDLLSLTHAQTGADGALFNQAKTGAKVLVQMTPDVRAVLDRIKGLQRVAGMTVFCDPQGKPVKYRTMAARWAKACKLAKVEDAHFHDIRAAAATDAKRDGLDSRTLLGHTTERSHQRYLRAKETPVATPNRRRGS